MKTVKYNWDNEIWLIHVEVKNNSRDNIAVRYGRLDGLLEKLEEEGIYLKPEESRRFIISRKSINEKGITITHDNNVKVKVFKLLDRAYLPTDSDICQLEAL